MSAFNKNDRHTFGFDESCHVTEVGDWAEWSLRVDPETVMLTTESGNALWFTKAEWREICARVRLSWRQLKEKP